MSYLLACDTSGATMSVALVVYDPPGSQANFSYQVQGVISLREGRRHAVTLQPSINSLLQESGISYQAVSALAVTLGPGSFTGIRIGLATVMGLAFVRTLPVYAFSSLAVLAAGALLASADRGNLPQFFLPVVDARGGRVFAGLYKLTEDLSPVPDKALNLVARLVALPAWQERPYTATELVRELSSHAVTEALPVGDGVPVLLSAAPELARAQNTSSDICLASEDVPHHIEAEVLAKMALNDIFAGNMGQSAATLQASYGIKSSAERMLQEEVQKQKI